MPKQSIFEILNYNSTSRNDEYQPPAILYICAGSLSSNSTFQQLIDWREKIWVDAAYQ